MMNETLQKEHPTMAEQPSQGSMYPRRSRHTSGFVHRNLAAEAHNMGENWDPFPFSLSKRVIDQRPSAGDYTADPARDE